MRDDSETLPDSGEKLPQASESPDLVDFISSLLESSPFEIRCRVKEEDDRLRIEIEGPDRDLFLERRGEGLLALQTLLGRVAVKMSHSKPVFVDSDGFRQGREEEIAEIAILAAGKVKKMGEPHKLRPMDPYERRLVHIALKDDPGVETESEGDGFQRSVVIRPRRKNH
jgi:spoIIIJ-associated protein